MGNQNETEQKEKKTPEITFRAGNVKATIWKNTQTNEKGESHDFYNVAITRSYKDKNDQWQETNQYRHNDLPKVELVSRKAYEHLLTNKD